jgi:hypothetical protein
MELATGRSISREVLSGALAHVIVIISHTLAKADEGGVSFWIPGFFGSLAAAPQQAGWSLTTMYYHTSVSAGGVRDIWVTLKPRPRPGHVLPAVLPQDRHWRLMPSTRAY